MEDFLVWLLAAYGCASLLVFVLERVARFVNENGTPEHQPVHFHLMLHNSENVLEGVLRRLSRFSVIHGKAIHISFSDFGSTDDTLKIAALYTRKHSWLLESAELMKPHTVIDLRGQVQEERG